MGGMPAVTSPILNVIEMGDQLARHLTLCSDHLLQANNLIHQYFVSLGELEILLLKSLDLMLCCCKRLAQDDDLLRGWERVLCLCLFSRSGSLPPNVVKVVFPISPEFWMSEFPSLLGGVSARQSVSVKECHQHRVHMAYRHSPRYA